MKWLSNKGFWSYDLNNLDKQHVQLLHGSLWIGTSDNIKLIVAAKQWKIISIWHGNSKLQGKHCIQRRAFDI